MPDYEAKIGISVDTQELDDAEKRINDLVRNKQTIKIDTSGSVKNIDDITDSVKNAQKSTLSFGDIFKRALGIGTTATLAVKSIRLIGKAAKEAFENIKVLDKSMTELRKVTDETPQTYKKILSNASTTAKEIGTSIHGLIDSTADFARLGYTVWDSEELAKVANIYAVVGDEVGGIDSATKSIISTMAAFGITASNSISIVDKFNKVGNEFAISSGGIGSALERSASSMAAAGNSLDQSIALITAANTVVQNPESIGTAFKTITMRIRGAKTELEDAGLSTDGMATSVSKLRDEIRALSGVDIMQNDSTFKSTYQIMDELSQKWKELSDIQKASITELIAGKRQGNIVSSLMENFDIARNALNSSLNSDGSAMREHEKWLDSIEAKTNQLKASFESLSINVISSDVVGDITSATTALITFIDKSNLVQTGLAGLTAAGAIKGFAAITTGITNAAIAMDKFNTALTISKSANIGKSQLEQLVQITTTLSASQTNAIITAKALSTEQRMAILTARGMSQAEAEAALASMDLASAEGAATASTLSLKGAFQGLMATLKPFAPLIIGAAAAFATFKTMQYYSFDGFYKRATKDQEALEATKNTLAETASAIENNKAKIEELRSQRSSGTGGSVSDINSEIRRLEQENAILEQKKKIYKENQKIEQQKAAESAGKALTQTDLYDTQVFNEETGVYESKPEKRTILDNVQADIAKAKELQTALDNNAKSIVNIDTSTKEGQEQFNKLSDQRSRLQAALAETQTSVNQQKESILALYSALFDSDGNIISGYEGLVDQIQGIFPELVTSAEDTGTAIATAFESVTANIDESVTDTKSIVESIGKVQELVAKQKAGATLSPEDLNTDGIKEYAEALEYTNGVYQLNAEKVRELVKAKTEEQISTNNLNKAMAQSQYMENAKQIQKLRELLNSDSVYRDKNSESIRAQIDELISQNSTLADSCNSLNMYNAALEAAASAYNNWLNAQSGSDYGDMADQANAAYKKITETITSGDGYGAKYQAAVEFLVPDSVDQNDTSAVSQYMASLKKYMKADGNGLDVGAILGESVNKGIMDLDSATGTYTLKSGVTMKQWAEELNVSMGMMQAMIDEMNSHGFNFDFSDEAIPTFGDLAIKANEAAESLRGLNGVGPIKLDFSDLPTKEDQINGLQNTISQMNQIKARPDVDTSQIEAANDVIQYCVAQMQELNRPVIMNVDTSKVGGEMGDAISLLQQFQNATNRKQQVLAIDATADTSGIDAEISALESKIQGLSPEVKAQLNLDTTSIDSISSSIEGITAEILVTCNVDEGAIAGYNPDEKTCTVNYVPNTSALPNSFAPITRTVNYVATGAVSGTGGVNGTAHAQGTAYVRGTAKASGDWGNKRPGNTLVGELGREIVVDPHSGRWYTVGDNGAEFAYIPKDAIVFNHIQSESLLNNGYAIGRGHSLATGTAMVTGGGVWKPGGSYKGGSSNDIGSGSSSGGGGSNTKSKADKDKVDWIEIAIERFEALLKKLSNIAENTFNNLITRLNATNENITATRKDIEFQSKAYDRYIEEANKVGLKEDIAEKVRNGDLDINSYDEKTRDKITQYQKWYEKAEDSAEAIEDLKTSLAELYKSKFDNVQKDFENKLSLMEERAVQFDTELKRLEAKGYTANASIYESQRKDKQDRITVMTAQLAEMQKSFDELVASGFLQEGSEAWYEMMLEIQKVKNEIAETDVEIIELNNDIRQLKWDSFDKALESISDLNDEADFLISILSGEKLTDEVGNLTSEGMAALGLRAQKIDTYMAQSQRYADEIARLDKEISEDPLNNTLIERRKELLKLQRESITAAQDEKEAMKDLVSEGIDAQLDSIKELIDAYNDSLDSAKDLYEYQKNIADKTKAISDIEKQLAAYQGDNSQENRARLQKLQSDLKEAEQDLKDTEYDRFISDTKELLDDFYSDYEETLQKQLENTDELIEELIQSVNGNSSSILSTLQDVTKEVGIGLSQEITDIWTNSGSSWNVVSSGADKVADKVSSVFEVARAIYKNTCLIAGESATMSFASGGLVDYTGKANVHGTKSKPELMLNAGDTKNFLELRDALRYADIPMAQHSVRNIDFKPMLSQITEAINAHKEGQQITAGDTVINIEIDHVEDYNDFVRQLQKDSKFEKMIQSMTLGRLSGKSPLDKYSYSWK